MTRRLIIPKTSCIHELFEAQVEKTPDAIAVQFEGKQLTYRELNARANQLAHYLRGIRSWSGESWLGSASSGLLEMVIGLLGILKAGGAYVPLDPAYPRERLEFMLKDAQVFRSPDAAKDYRRWKWSMSCALRPS